MHVLDVHGRNRTVGQLIHMLRTICRHDAVAAVAPFLRIAGKRSLRPKRSMQLVTAVAPGVNAAQQHEAPARSTTDSGVLSSSDFSMASTSAQKLTPFIGLLVRFALHTLCSFRKQRSPRVGDIRARQ